MSLNPLAGALALLTSVLPLSGCATEAGDSQPENPVAAEADVVVAQSGHETRLRRGQALAIELGSNASTGYSWEIVEDGSPILAPVPVPQKTGTAAPPMPGAGGTSRWRFQAVQPGIATLRLVYRRAWEKEVAPARTAVYSVRVE